MFIDWLTSQDFTKLDGHFAAQSSHCELWMRVHDYTDVILMKRESFADEAACFLQRAGLDFLNVVNGTSNQSFFAKKTKEYARKHKTDHLLKSYYTQKAAEKIMDLYASDYRTFRLPRPSWVQNARGEFFDIQYCEPDAKK
eukprot:TRINITY_DN20841_c0_g1_i1.p3 TRINITY_DN20841_c0_g1~~TRINITY_DN20841_c0_g1_i1.p3  ORF type:complete len:141 (+),score=22.46 TRINITY_DN20841_c0_g1_i1:711-1133(+)